MTETDRLNRFRTAFGAALSVHLAKRGITQAVLANRVGYSTAYINQTMTGRKPPPADLIVGVAEALSLTKTEEKELEKAADTD